MKKVLSFFILCIFILNFTGCGTKVNNEENSTDVAEVARDFGGYEFLFASPWTDQYFIDEGTTSTGDAMNKRYAELEAKYNVKILPALTDYTSNGSNFIANYGASLKTGDIVDVNCYTLYPLYQAGLLVPYDEVTMIDLSDPRWSPAAFRAPSVFNGKTYGIFPYQWQNVPEFNGTTCFNNEILKAFSQPTPYELLEKGTWDWNTFYNMVDACDDKIDDKRIYGLICQPTIFMITAIFSNGGDKVLQNNDGTYKFGYLEQNAIDALTWGKTLKQFSNTDNAQFGNGNAAFIVSESWYCINRGEGNPQDTLQDFGFMPFPNGPKSAFPDTVNAYVSSNNRLIGILSPISDLTVDDIGFIMNELFAPLNTEETWKNYAERYLLHHPQDYTNFIKMIENIKYDNASAIGQTANDKINTTLNTIFSTDSKTPVEAMQGIKDIVDVAVKEGFASSNQ